MVIFEHVEDPPNSFEFEYEDSFSYDEDGSGAPFYSCHSCGLLIATTCKTLCVSQAFAQLPIGIRAVWDLEKTYREKTKTRERVCLNGLWRWQPAKDMMNVVPSDKWGYFKVPGSWPGIADYMQKDSQTVYAHPSWKDESLSSINTVWYQREIQIPNEWTDRHIALSLEYLNSYAVVYVDGKQAGEIRFPGGEA